jgi:hypothetical protein
MAHHRSRLNARPSLSPGWAKVTDASNSVVTASLLGSPRFGLESTMPLTGFSAS